MQSQPLLKDTCTHKHRSQRAWSGATRLCALLAVAACGPERSPWNGFALFPEGSDAGPFSAASQPPPSVQVAAAESGDARLQPPTAGFSAPAANVPDMPATGAGAPGVPVTPVAVVGPGQPQLQGAFRITALYLRDPHIFVGTSDITEAPVLGMSVNRSLIPDQLGKDADKDGFLDASLILQLTTGDVLALPGAQLVMSSAKCPTSPNVPCKPEAGLSAIWSVELRASGECLSPLPMTTSAYQPPVSAPSAPCFVTTNANDLTMDLGGIKIQVTAARIGATYQLQPRAALTQGLIAGFVTNAAAMAAIVPSEAGPPVGGSALSTFVRQRDHDLAMSPNMQDGFWMYLNFVAEPVQYESAP
jgi:hypothetical protein